MRHILNNPYRTLGILAGATAKEQNKQATRLKQYINAGQKPPQDDCSFPVFGNLNRTIESVNDAVSEISQDKDKMTAALFWFWKGNDITDEPAFDALKDGNMDTAYRIWNKMISKINENGKNIWVKVSERNAAAYHNFFVLEMLRTNGNKTDAVRANLYFLESDFYHKFVSDVTDITFKTTARELQLNFLNAILQEIEAKTIALTVEKFIPILNGATFTSKVDFFKSISQKYTDKITVEIETAKIKRTENNANAAIAGEELYMKTKKDLEQLKSILGEQDFSYSNVADKVANEILQCSIDFFNDSQEKEIENFIDIALNVAELANSIAVGNLVSDRIHENLKTMSDTKQYALCWYCKKNIAKKEYAYEKEIYKETSRNTTWNGQRQVFFNQTKISIPRCKKCNRIHSKGGVVILVLLIVLYIITFIIFWYNVIRPENEWGSVILFIILGWIPAAIITRIVTSIVNSINAKKNKILKENNIKMFPPLLKLLREGWKLSKPEA